MKPYIVVMNNMFKVFEEIVNQKIRQGYEPIGGVSVSNGGFAQALIYKKKEK